MCQVVKCCELKRKYKELECERSGFVQSMVREGLLCGSDSPERVTQAENSKDNGLWVWS